LPRFHRAGPSTSLDKKISPIFNFARLYHIEF
jgi:hypothetical protein